MSSSVAEAVTKERLHSSGEDYLKSIFILEAQHGSVRSVEVAEYMNVSKASVNHAVSIEASQYQRTQHNGDQHLDGSIDVALTGIATDGTAVEGKHGRHGIDRGGLDASDSGLGGMGDLLDELLHEIFLL